MGRLIFEAADLRRIIDHTLANPQSERAVNYDATTGKMITKPVEAPAVILAHDHGVYLMSNGNPPDIADPAAGSRSYVAYCKGCHPDRDSEWWENARDLVGGDDFGETLPWANEIKGHLDRGATQIVINFGARRASLSAKYPKLKATA